MPKQDLLAHHKIDELFKTLRTLIRWSGGGVLAYCGWQAVESMVGQNTNFVLSLLADLKFSLTIALAGSAAIWALLERTIRQRTVERMQGRIKELEMKIDPRRTSSGLTPKGRTNSRDKDD